MEVKIKKIRINKKSYNFIFIIAIAVAFVFFSSPILLHIDSINKTVDYLLSSLKYTEYKEAYIGATGGLIGACIAIPGALWVERKIFKYNEKKEIEKVAFILYYDIKLFYEEVALLAGILSSITSITSKQEQLNNFIKYKNRVGIHIHPDWINLTATLKDNLNANELESIYLFYGKVSDINKILENHNVTTDDIKRINEVLDNIGKISNNEYLPDEKHKAIMLKLKDIANYHPEQNH